MEQPVIRGSLSSKNNDGSLRAEKSHITRRKKKKKVDHAFIGTLFLSTHNQINFGKSVTLI